MTTQMTGLLIGFLFGGGLILAGLANPDKIIGTLRLKDFHAMRVIGVFVLVGMLGTWILTLTGHANLSVKPATVLTVLVGGGLLGVGFGMTGFCPGTGLACAMAGRLDAVVSVLGMFAGAFVYILIYPSTIQPLEKIWDYGKATLPELTGVSATVYVLVFVIGGGVALWATRPRGRTA